MWLAIGDKIVFLKNENDNIFFHKKDPLALDIKGLSNGLFGRICGFDQESQTVRVEVEGGTLATFSLHNYSDFTHGYALTVHKAQGKTVDFVLTFLSKSMDAFSTYVAGTRHKEECHFYYDKEEFKNVNALTHHLSKIRAQGLAEDMHLHEKDKPYFEAVQNFLSLCHDLRSLYKDVLAEGGDTFGEAKRAYKEAKAAQITFAKHICAKAPEHQKFVRFAGLSMEEIKIVAGFKKGALSLEDQKAKLDLEIFGQTAHATREMWNQMKKEKNITSHPFYPQWKTLRSERDALANEILENYQKYRRFFYEFTKEYGLTKKALENMVAYHQNAQIERVSKEVASSFAFTVNAPQSKNSALKNELDRQRKPLPQKQVAFEQTSHEIVEKLTDHMAEIATQLLGKPSTKKLCQWRFGSKGSVVVDVFGQHKGRYVNFESSVKGNVVTLIGEQLGLNKKEAFKWGISWLGHDRTPQVVKEGESSSMLPEKTLWTPLKNPSKPFPDLNHTPSLASLMRGRHEVARYAYYDENKNLLGYVVRLEDQKGNKITPTLTYCQHDKGPCEWRWQGFGNHRPLYGLDLLKERKELPVLVVEGEKTCEAARELFKDYVVITWSGGCGAVHKTDWSPLKGREVILFPDHDQVGQNAVLKIGDILKGLNDPHKKGDVHIVDLPSTLPHKWDLADEMPQEHTPYALITQTKEHTVMKYEIFLKTLQGGFKGFCEKEITDVMNEFAFHVPYYENAASLHHFIQEAQKIYLTHNKIASDKSDEKTLDKKAILAGLYGMHVDILFGHFCKTNGYTVEKAVIAGCLASNASFIHKDKINLMNQHDFLIKAFETVQKMHDKVELHLQNPPEVLKDNSKEIQREMLINSHTFKLLTHENLPASLNKEIHELMNQLNPQEHRIEHIQEIIHHVMLCEAHHIQNHEIRKLSPACLDLRVSHKMLQEHDTQIHIQTQQRTVHEQSLQRQLERDTLHL